MSKFLVIDLEATCDSPRNLPRDQTEIIEIGAVIADRLGTVEREFQTFVRPTIHGITPFCTELTTIRPEDVRHAPLFRAALAKLASFMNGEPLTFCSWGNYDKNQFRRQATRGGLTLPFRGAHINLKARFAEAEGASRQRGLGGAIRRAGLRFDGTAHRGIDDARNIARLLPFCLGERPLP